MARSQNIWLQMQNTDKKNHIEKLSLIFGLGLKLIYVIMNEYQTIVTMVSHVCNILSFKNSIVLVLSMTQRYRENNM